MEVHYCEGWFRARKIAVNIWEIAEARTAYVNRQMYTALIGSPTAPECFVESTGDAIGLGFLDDLLREHVSYEFEEKEPGKLFLSMATERKFEGDTDNVTWAITYFFDEDGHVVIRETDVITDLVTQAETYLDVSANWEPYPEFGQYESIARKDRVELISIANKKDNLFE